MSVESLRIGVDGRLLQERRSGLGRYIFEICRALHQSMPAATFFVYGPPGIELPINSLRWIPRIDTLGLARRLNTTVWLKLRVGVLCHADNLDVFWASGTFLPRLSRNVPIVSTVYDLSYRIVPDTMRLSGVTSRMFFETDVRRADAVVAISQGTANRLAELFGVQAAAIVRPSVSDKFARFPPARVQAVLDAYGVRQPYILSVATWEPRKNLELLIQTYQKMKNQGLLGEHSLVLAGGRGWKDKRLVELVRRQERSAIQPLGYVPDALLPALYCGARLFVFPSIYEGFGIPVLEARACRTRVVTSDTPELREAGGQCATYVAPTAEGIHQGILAALKSSAPGLNCGSDFPTWAESGAAMAQLFERM